MTIIRTFGSALFLLVLATACQKNNCPRYWAAPDNAQVASDGRKDPGENLDVTEAEGEKSERTTELSVIRVKRDKNGIVVKQQPKKRKKYKDPRKHYKD